MSDSVLGMGSPAPRHVPLNRDAAEGAPCRQYAGPRKPGCQSGTQKQRGVGCLTLSLTMINSAPSAAGGVSHPPAHSPKVHFPGPVPPPQPSGCVCVGGCPRPGGRAPICPAPRRAGFRATPTPPRSGRVWAGLTGPVRPARASSCRSWRSPSGRFAARCRCPAPAASGGRPRVAPADRNGQADGAGAAGACKTPELGTAARGVVRLALRGGLGSRGAWGPGADSGRSGSRPWASP